MHRPRWPQQQIPEIGGVGVQQSALVIGIDAGSGAQAMRVDRQGVAIGLGDHSLHFRWRLVGRDQVVLELGQAAAHQFQRIAANRRDAVSAGQVQRLERASDDPTVVVSIEYIEAGAQAGDLGFDPELARGKAVECPEPGWR